MKKRLKKKFAAFARLEGKALSGRYAQTIARRLYTYGGCHSWGRYCNPNDPTDPWGDVWVTETPRCNPGHRYWFSIDEDGTYWTHRVDADDPKAAKRYFASSRRNCLQSEHDRREAMMSTAEYTTSQDNDLQDLL